MNENSSTLVVGLVIPSLRLPRDFLRRTDILALGHVGHADIEAEVLQCRQSVDTEVLVRPPGGRVDILRLGSTPVETLRWRGLIDSLRSEDATAGAQRLGDHTDIFLTEDTAVRATTRGAEDQEVRQQRGDWQRQSHVQRGTDGSIPLSGHPSASALVKIYQ